MVVTREPDLFTVLSTVIQRAPDAIYFSLAHLACGVSASGWGQVRKNEAPPAPDFHQAARRLESDGSKS